MIDDVSFGYLFFGEELPFGYFYVGVVVFVAANILMVVSIKYMKPDPLFCIHTIVT